MQYDITDITDGVATIQYSDGSITYIQLWSDMTEADLDHLAYQNSPMKLRTGTSKPSFLPDGPSTRTAAVQENTVIIEEKEPWLVNRESAYGTMAQQLEYITENGLEAWQTKVAQIKADNPKT